MIDKNVKILITGGSGFVGSHLIEALLAAGYGEIHSVDRSNKSDFVKELIPTERLHQADLTDHQQIGELIEKLKPQQIYHLASLANVSKSFSQRKFILETNLNIQLNLLDAIKEHAPTARLLSVGTALAYQKSEGKVDETAVLQPSNPYALSKLIQDLLSDSYAQSEKLDIVRVRPFNHIGERQALGFVVSDFAMQIAKIEAGEQASLKVGNLAAVRDFTDVKDMVAAYILLMEKGASGEVYNVGSGLGISIAELLKILLSLAKSEIRVEIESERLRPIDLAKLVCDNGKITSLGWQAQHQIEETLLRILNWWRNNR